MLTVQVKKLVKRIIAMVELIFGELDIGIEPSTVTHFFFTEWLQSQFG